MPAARTAHSETIMHDLTNALVEIGGSMELKPAACVRRA